VNFPLARWRRPDVALRDPNRLRLFVGDAKVTEVSTNLETRIRLRSYTSATLPWRRAGFSVRLAVWVSARHGDDWMDLLSDFGLASASASSVTLATAERLVWVDLPPVLDDVSGRHYRARYGQLTDSRRHVLRSGRAV
jgi:hypothetical protein